MGYRAHVCTRFDVRYGSGCFCAAHCDDVNHLLYESGAVEYADPEESIFELNPDRLRLLADELGRGEMDSEVASRFGGDVTPGELADVFLRWLEEADKDNGFIRIEWF